MDRWLTGALGLALLAGLASCGGPSSQGTCGMNGGHPQREIGGEILYYCWDQPTVNGGIYLLDVATGQARALTSDLAYNLDGAWSPDGSTIAFQSTREGRDEIFTMDVHGGQIRRLTDGRGFNEYPSWSPDGRWILFNSTRDGIADGGATGYYRDLYLMRPDGTDVHRVSRHSGTFAFAAWSPDGRTLAFQSDRSLRGISAVVAGRDKNRFRRIDARRAGVDLLAHRWRGAGPSSHHRRAWPAVGRLRRLVA
ncbi:MAG: hypothetical protein E6I04_15445 [Chloroflexi bacterium]|nr:MAG: hypothetical protein E6I04_15445 [Chloroflexota bacterium]